MQKNNKESPKKILGNQPNHFLPTSNSKKGAWQKSNAVWWLLVALMAIALVLFFGYAISQCPAFFSGENTPRINDSKKNSD